MGRERVSGRTPDPGLFRQGHLLEVKMGHTPFCLDIAQAPLCVTDPWLRPLTRVS